MITSPLGRKKLLCKWRSQNSSSSAASNTENAITLSSAAVNHPHTVSGSRCQVMPSQRSFTMVVSVFTALIVDAMPKIAILASQQSIPAPCPGPASALSLSGGYAVHPPMGPPPGTKNAASKTSSASAVSHMLAALMRGNAMRCAPICAGRIRFPNPDCGATVSTKNSISVPCMVTSARYSSGRIGPCSGSGQSGHARCARIAKESSTPTPTATAEIAR